MIFSNLIKKITECYALYRVYIQLTISEIIGQFEVLNFNVQLMGGTTKKKVFEYAEDVKTVLHLRNFVPYEEDGEIYISISLYLRQNNSLINMLTCTIPYNNGMSLPLSLGYDLKRRKYYIDLEKIIHLLITGPTNCGKSTLIRNIIFSLIFMHSVDQLNMVVFDIGASSMSIFEKSPHLCCPIVKNAIQGCFVINALVAELNRRADLDIEELSELPAIVVVIDEYSSLMNRITDKNMHAKLTQNLSSLLQRGRKGKIHIVIGNQSGTKAEMKAEINNIVSRISFRCAIPQESNSCIGTSGADKLSGIGTFLYVSKETSAPIHIQGAYISDKDAKTLVEHINNIDYDIRNKFMIPEIDVSEMREEEVKALTDSIVGEDTGRNEELAKVIMYALGKEKLSANELKKVLKGGNRINEIVEKLEKYGIISEKYFNQPRTVLPASIGDLASEVRELLSKYEYSDELITEIINKRFQRAQP